MPVSADDKRFPSEYMARPCEFKAVGDKGEYEGHFSIFGNIDSYQDIVEPGAFKKTIAERGKRVKVFLGHDWGKLIGPPPFELKEDSVGLFAAGRLTLESFWGHEAWVLMKDGALAEGSFGFRAIQYDYDDADIRHLREVRLYEISPVPLGANPLTSVQAIKAALAGGVAIGEERREMGEGARAVLEAVTAPLLSLKGGDPDLGTLQSVLLATLSQVEERNALITATPEQRSAVIRSLSDALAALEQKIVEAAKPEPVSGHHLALLERRMRAASLALDAHQ